MRILSMIVGGFCVVMGGLWTGQGLGLIMWPETSPMLAQGEWVTRGALLAAAGLLLIWLGRRKAT
jgi:hypothetical protein